MEGAQRMGGPGWSSSIAIRRPSVGRRTRARRLDGPVGATSCVVAASSVTSAASTFVGGKTPLAAKRWEVGGVAAAKIVSKVLEAAAGVTAAVLVVAGGGVAARVVLEVAGGGVAARVVLEVAGGGVAARVGLLRPAGGGVAALLAGRPPLRRGGGVLLEAAAPLGRGLDGGVEVEAWGFTCALPDALLGGGGL